MPLPEGVGLVLVLLGLLVVLNQAPDSKSVVTNAPSHVKVEPTPALSETVSLFLSLSLIMIMTMALALALCAHRLLVPMHLPRPKRSSHRGRSVA